MSLNWGHLLFLLWLSMTRVMGSWEEDHRNNIFIAFCQHDWSLLVVTLAIRLQSRWSSFSPGTPPLLLPLCVLHFWETSHWAVSTVRKRGGCFSPPGGSNCAKYLEFYMGHFSILDGRTFKGKRKQFEVHLSSLPLSSGRAQQEDQEWLWTHGQVWRLEGVWTAVTQSCAGLGVKFSKFC